MNNTNIERIKAGINFFKVVKKSQDKELVIKYFWNFIDLVDLYINGNNSGVSQINSAPEVKHAIIAQQVAQAPTDIEKIFDSKLI